MFLVPYDHEPTITSPIDHIQNFIDHYLVANQRWSEWLKRGGKNLLIQSLTHSPFLCQLLNKNYQWLGEHLDLDAETLCNDILKELDPSFSCGINQQQVMHYMRIRKQRIALLIALADISGRWPLERVTYYLSEFAAKSCQFAVSFIIQQAIHQGHLRALVDPSGEEAMRQSGWIILAMGKLGAYELNYSSDIDLIILYNAEKTTYQGSDISHFFIRATRLLVQLLQERTIDGYVFRVDLRLRPDPASMPLAISTQTAELYYETVGQNWERAALIKARPLCADTESGYDFLNQLRPYIWRKYLDFAALEDIRSIKRQIESTHLQAPDELAGYNIKLGHGGIREIEFFVQTQQLIWGGKHPALRIANSCDALKALAKQGLISMQTADELIDIYRYLRTLEHRLQMVADEQTHQLPETIHGLDAIAQFIGQADRNVFIAELRRVLSVVKQHYHQLFRSSAPLSTQQGNLVFTGTDHDPETLHNLSNFGFLDCSKISEAIRGWHHGRYRATRSKHVRERITELTPAILKAISRTTNPDLAFNKFDEFLSRLPANVPLFDFFHAHPELLDLMADILGSYPYLAELLSRKPYLLDVVLMADFLTPVVSLAILKQELDQRLDPWDEYEAILDQCRIWTHEKQFQVGIQLLRCIISPQTARSILSAIAEAVLDTLAQTVRCYMNNRIATIPSGQFAVVAMGKLGSCEMTFDSDIDLILLYDVDQNSAIDPLNGPSLDQAAAYFGRLSRYFIASFTTLTQEGKLYNIDMRLRPSGSDGPICTSLQTLDHYFGHVAHWWEYMALTRARTISAPDDFALRIHHCIHGKLTSPFDPLLLGNHVHEIRQKIAQTYPIQDPWRIKYVRGGLIDAEFIAQYLQLRYGFQYPAILHVKSHIVFEQSGKLGILPPQIAEELYEMTLFLADIQSVLRLCFERIITPSIKKILLRFFPYPQFEDIEQRLLKTQHAIRNYFDQLIPRS
jgi:glutamate-ammonia-ligase adenylyltransferase